MEWSHAISVFATATPPFTASLIVVGTNSTLAVGESACSSERVLRTMMFVQGFHALMSTSDTRTSSTTIFVIMIEVGPCHPLVFFSDRCPLLPTDHSFMKPHTSR
ncbi:hypothetical protein IW262DRAFT_525666 [Armillaria fumosa]|nr:hypothetical protein IW262DRAFT_525666 [Armillaria fumosa]